MGVISFQAVSIVFPQVGGNRIAEAPKVIFDPTPRGEGMNGSNDSSKASLSPQVGSRLRSFRRDWQTNNCSDNKLSIITNGYILPFISKPKNSQNSCDYVMIQGPSKDQALASCIQSLLSKYAIERVENVKSLGFYSRLFLVPKSRQRWRPVIDLSSLNTFLLVERLKMETPEPIRASDSRGMGGIDRLIGLLPSHPHPSKLKKVPKVSSQVFQFTSLRADTTPHVFTMIVKEVKLMTLIRGIRLH